MRKVDKKTISLRKGLTWRTILLIVFGTFIVQPAGMYLFLIRGIWLPFQAWIVILLWTEIARLLGAPLSKEEIFIVTAFGGIAGALGGLTTGWNSLAASFLLPIRQMYIRTTEYARSLGIAQVAPDWWAPKPEVSQNLYLRKWVLLSSELALPQLLIVLSTLFSLIANISLGYFCYVLYVRVERLEFPAAMAEVRTVMTLAEREPSTIRVLMLSALMGVLINFGLRFLPDFINNILAGGTLTLSASPVVDFTTVLANILPGAGYAFTIDPLPYIAGFILPVGVSIAQFIGSLTYYFIGTSVITKMGLWPAETHPQTISNWDITLLVDRSVLYFFNSIHIGLSIAVAVIPFLLHPRIFSRLVSTLKKISSIETSSKLTRPYVLLGIFLTSAAASIALNLILVPALIQYIWAILFYTILWSFFTSFIATASAGVTIGSLNIIYQKELLIYYSGIKDPSVWFAPIEAFNRGSSIAQALKQADICGVRHSDYIKALLLVAFLGLLSSFLYVNLFWSIQPFPSGAYPYTITGWNVDAANFCRFQKWIWTGYLFRADWILGSFIVGSIVYAISDLIFHAPWFLISFLVGGFWWNPFSTYRIPTIAYSQAVLIGSLIGNKVIARILTKEVWNKYRSLIYVGVLLGDGYMGTLSAIIFLIKKSMWLLPY